MLAVLPHRLLACSAALTLCAACASGSLTSDSAAADPDVASPDANDGSADADDADDETDGTAAPQPADGSDGDGEPPASEGGAIGARPFGAHSSYAAGTILPDHRTRAELDALTAAYYDTWKARYLVAACADGQMRVRSQSATAAYTVSEAHGYGMLFAVTMEGHDPEARALFDGLHRYFRAHPSGDSADLMAWAQDEACNDVLGTGSAADGDLDIAYALLLADAQWGSAGEIDYRGEANRVIAAILAHEVSPQDHVQLGSWVQSDARANGTRSSDLIPAHFRAYERASGEARWSSVVDRLYDIVEHLQEGVARDSGLLPDFIVAADTDAPSPAPAAWLEGAHDGHYNYNACRVPWRLTADYLVHGEPRARAAVRRMNAFLRVQTGDDPAQLVDGYDLVGTPYGGSAGAAFIAPLLVGAMIEPESGTNQAWLNALWEHMLTKDAATYYNDSLQLAAMIVASGNYWTP